MQCPTCHQDGVDDFNTPPLFAWCLCLMCNNQTCTARGCTWVTCKECTHSTRQRTRYSDQRAVRDHNRYANTTECHKKQRTCPTGQAGTSSPPLRMSDDEDLPPSTPQPQHGTSDHSDATNAHTGSVCHSPLSCIHLCVCRQSSKDYFLRDICLPDGRDGRTSLVYKACVTSSNMGPGRIGVSETTMQLKIADLCFGITKGQRIKLANVLDMVVSHAKAEERAKYAAQPSDSTIITSTRVPTTEHLLRSTLLDGPHSVVGNLPHPQVHASGDNAYLKISDILSHILMQEHREDIVFFDPDADYTVMLPDVKYLHECGVG